MREAARALIRRYKVATPGSDAPISALSGGAVQRAALARELGGEVRILIAANPVFGLDFAAVADIHGQIVAARNGGAAVLLVSEDRDELLELSDRLLVMSEGRIVLETAAAGADRTAIGRAIGGDRRARRGAGVRFRRLSAVDRRADGMLIADDRARGAGRGRGRSPSAEEACDVRRANRFAASSLGRAIVVADIRHLVAHRAGAARFVPSGDGPARPGIRILRRDPRLRSLARRDREGL
jgi:energy-coupling factor transporter ATP-binding protein EcfA2